MERTRVLIMGAAGRDFHNFNTFYRDNEKYEVVAFTATQIPDIDDRKYPAELAGKLILAHALSCLLMRLIKASSMRGSISRIPAQVIP